MVSVMIERQYIRADALVVGSGAAGLNAAVTDVFPAIRPIMTRRGAPLPAAPIPLGI